MYRGKPKSDRSPFTPQILNTAINPHIQSHKPTTIPGKGFEQRQATKIDKLVEYAASTTGSSMLVKNLARSSGLGSGDSV
ncbi:MAG: hypothetical protein RMZ43_018530 [Nostoc sp. CmiVER01]|uniref:hypothetical protein n=1 Tax=Nostoc sp. CmiVER01 TaxID=3075384 RepID=UPI002AD22660|nr:hypothetical protein [Nostoc sp. CmiVER01]MDZ8126831.1 hypothetical protein [Nostoc sp. CmiVER01]